MKRMCIMYAVVSMAFLCFAEPARSAKGDPALLKMIDGAAVLRKAGVKSPSDIESVVIPIIGGNAYKITYQGDRASTERLYKALNRLALMDWPWMVTGWGRLILNLKSGKTVSVVFSIFGHGNDHDPADVFLAEDVLAPDLAPFYRDLLRNGNAAALDDSVPQFEVDRVEVGLPARGSNGFSPSSERVKPVLAKALAIVDSLDPRASFPAPVSEWEMDMARGKYGHVTIELSKPVRLDVYLNKDEKPQIHGEAGLFRPGIQRKVLVVNKLIVMEFGNYQPPVVIVQDTSKQYYLFSHLAKKFWKGNMPGHNPAPPADYESPQDLYREMRELAKVAFEKYAPETDSKPERPQTHDSPAPP